MKTDAGERESDQHGPDFRILSRPLPNKRQIHACGPDATAGVRDAGADEVCQAAWLRA